MTEAREPTNGGVVLEARGITKAYGAVQALAGVDVELRRGEVLGLVGDNGAGKTTLVKCLSGVHRPDAGTILIDGEDHGSLTAEFARYAPADAECCPSSRVRVTYRIERSGSRPVLIATESRAIR